MALSHRTSSFRFGALVAIFGTIVVVRWFKHREILAMVERGLLPAQYMSASRGRGGRGLLG